MASSGADEPVAEPVVVTHSVDELVQLAHPHARFGSQAPERVTIDCYGLKTDFQNSNNPTSQTATQEFESQYPGSY